jgi:hypothetical protein
MGSTLDLRHKTENKRLMTGHGDAHEAADADEHDDHHDDDHHAAPALEEPVTPLWLTLLGIGLFLVAGIAFVATRPSGKTTAELTGAGSAEAPPAEAPQPAARP